MAAIFSSSRITCLGGDDRGVAGAAAPHCHDRADLGTQAVSAESQQPRVYVLLQARGGHPLTLALRTQFPTLLGHSVVGALRLLPVLKE